jgi:glycosyltransferase involved in cell wall biosynthesis
VGSPLVSVVIPCWNQAHFLAEAIESALAQTHRPVEIAVVDDGSTDNTRKVVERYPSVRYLHQANRGPAAARNAGLATSSGAFVVFLDADDRLLADALETGVAVLRRSPELAFCAGQCRDIGTDGQLLGVPDQPLIHRDHYLALLKSCFILSGSSVLFTRWALDSVGGFDEARQAGDDYDLYLRIARRFPVACHGRVVTEYRRHGTSLTQDPALILAGELAALKAQATRVRGRDEHRAHRTGRRRAKRRHGEALTQLLETQIQLREWGPALRTTAVLLWEYPRGLSLALRDLRS